MNDWHTRSQRTQHLSGALARRGFPVIYVNPHLGREFPSGFRRGEDEKLLQLDTNLFELHVHLKREPVFHHRRLRKDESLRVASAVTNALQRIGATWSIQLTAFPVWLDAALTLRAEHGAPIIYDCHDYLPGYSGVAPELLELETELFRASDLILCTSTSLMKRAGSMTAAPRVLLRNAAAAEFFAITPQRPTQITIGYAGALDSWFDVDAIRYASEKRPAWRFELIGRVENAAVAALSNLPNVRLAGEIPFADLPARLALFSAAVIPFRLSALIEATDPIKAYEYLACRLPVVASAMPELKRFGDLIAYTTPEDFLSKLDHAVGPQPPDVLWHRRQFVEAETWEARGAELAQLLEQWAP